MKRKLLYSLIFAIVVSCALFVFTACGAKLRNGGEAQLYGNGDASIILGNEDSEPKMEGEYDQSKLVVENMEQYAAGLTVEASDRCKLPVPTVKYDGKVVSAKVKVFKENGDRVDIISRGTRFFADETVGKKYFIKYYLPFESGDVEIYSIEVVVQDNTGPTIELPSYANYITVNRNDIVTIPVANIYDEGGEITASTVTVKRGNSVICENEASFTATEYGTYTVTYTATDQENNSSATTIEVTCARNIQITDFSTDEEAFGFLKGYEAQHVEYNGKQALHLVGKGGGNYVKVVCYPRYFDLSGFDRILISLYTDRESMSENEGFYLLNERYPLSVGDNIISIDRETLMTQYPDGLIPSTNAMYNDQRYLWLQYVGSGDVILYNMIGVFGDYDQDTQKPVIDLGKFGCTDEVEVNVGEPLPNPANLFKVYDNSMENITLNFVVKRGNQDITSQVIAGTFIAEEDETYTVTLSAHDSAGNNAVRKVVDYVVVTPKSYDDTGRTVKLLQSFEADDINTVFRNAYDPYDSTTDRVDYRVTDGDYSGKLYTVGSWESLFIKMTMPDGSLLTEEELDKIAYIAIDIFSDKEGMLPYFFNLPLGRLKLGYNKVYISGSNFKAQMMGDKTAQLTIGEDDDGNPIYAQIKPYDENGWAYFLIENGTKGFTFNIDNIRAYYLKDGEQPEDPYIVPEGEEDENRVMLQTFDSDMPFNTSFYTAYNGLPQSQWPGNTVKHRTQGDASMKMKSIANWQMVLINLRKNGEVLTTAEMDKISYISIDIYAELPEGMNSVGFYYFNHLMGNLEYGKNTLTISGADFKTQMTGSANGVPAYDNRGFGYFQVQFEGVTLYFDNCFAYYYGDEPVVPVDPVDPEPESNTKILQTFDTDQPFDVSLYTAYNDDTQSITGNTADHKTQGDACMRMKSIASNQMILINLKIDGQPLTLDDLDDIDYISIDIYAELPDGMGGTDFTFYNQVIGWIVAGGNTLTVSGADFKAQMLAEQTAAAPAYNTETGWAYFQVVNSGVTLYFDNCVAVYKTAE